MEINLCCFGNSFAKNFDLSWRISKELCISIETNLEIAVGGVQCYGLGGMCEEDMAEVRGASRTIGRLYAATDQRAGSSNRGR
jgi:hypothetical protein